MGWAVLADFWLTGWTPVTSTATLSAEAGQGLANTSQPPLEAAQGVAATAQVLLEIQGGIAQSVLAPVETGPTALQVVSTAGSFLDAVQLLAGQSALAVESAKGLTNELGILWTSPSLLTDPELMTASSAAGLFVVETQLRPLSVALALPVDVVGGVNNLVALYTSPLLQTSPSLLTADLSTAAGPLAVEVFSQAVTQAVVQIDGTAGITASKTFALDAWASVIPNVPGSVELRDTTGVTLELSDEEFQWLELVESGSDVVLLTDG